MTFIYSAPCKHSSQIPYIQFNGKEQLRSEFWGDSIASAMQTLPHAACDPVYIATGGGYGSYGTLINYLKSNGSIPADIPSVRGEHFRDLPALEAEKEAVREEIRAQAPAATPEAVEVILRSFYSNEVNTEIAKKVVETAIDMHIPVIHESASIYEDTIERAKLAKANGVKTMLIAGDCDHLEAIKTRTGDDKFNTIVSFKKFSARFESELEPLFDEIKLFNTDHNPPALIAQKKGAGQPLEIIEGQEQAYANFKAKAFLDENKYKTPHTQLSVTAQEHQERSPKAPNLPSH